MVMVVRTGASQQDLNPLAGWALPVCLCVLSCLHGFCVDTLASNTVSSSDREINPINLKVV